MSPRVTTLRSQLVRLGFKEPDRSSESIESLGEAALRLVAFFARTADPDEAVAGFCALVEASTERDQIIQSVCDDEGTAMRLLSVLGASRALAEHLGRHPEQWRELTDPDLGSTRPAAYAVRAGLLGAVGADPGVERPIATLTAPEAENALRVEYRRVLLRLAARDLAHHMSVDDVAAELAELAAGTLEAALAVARSRVVDASAVRLAIVAMGKCGGHELNYVSDVDVLFIAEPVPGADEAVATGAATQLASMTMQVCADNTAEGTIWPVDPNLRPEGRSGSLVRSLNSYRAYYERWAKTWEFQALLKARPVAGDLDLGREFCAMVAPLIWNAASRDGFVDDVQAMRRRVIDHIPAAEADRQLKLGSGGLRDVEFAVQLLQLVHGRTDESVRAAATLSALADLTRGGYVGRDDGRTMHDAYAFLRKLEHRIQLYDLRRTHVVPDDEESLRRLGRAMGYLRAPAKELTAAWQHHRREAQRLHEKLFYRPLLSAVARMSGDEAGLSPESARQRLAALGYADPDAALRHLEALTGGVSRTAAIQRALLPAMLDWFADAPDPDAGLFGFRRISESLGATHWYLRLLRDEGQAAQRLAQVLATSRYATQLLEREPDGVMILGEKDLTPIPLETLLAEMDQTARRRSTASEAVVAVRAIRRRQLLRTSVADLCEPFGVAEVGYALTDIADATLEAALGAVVREEERRRGSAMPTRVAIIAMGRYGGGELGYGSDADVMFVHEPIDGADAHDAATAATRVVNGLRRLLELPATDPPLEIDADLRPEGRNGPMVRTLESYAAYYAKWSATWEAQALLRAYPAVGDAGVRERFAAIIDPLRYPATGLSESDLLEIRRIKARIDDERLPRGVDPSLHFKLGAGGLSDVEWTVQLLQLQHASQVEGLRTARTLPALDAAREAGLLADDDAEALTKAWLLASRLRNATVQVRGKPADQLPTNPRERAAVAAVLCYGPGETETMLNDYRRAARRARAVVDRVFWGE